MHMFLILPTEVIILIFLVIGPLILVVLLLSGIPVLVLLNTVIYTCYIHAIYLYIYIYRCICI